MTDSELYSTITSPIRRTYPSSRITLSYCLIPLPPHLVMRQCSPPRLPQSFSSSAALLVSRLPRVPLSFLQADIIESGHGSQTMADLPSSLLTTSKPVRARSHSLSKSTSCNGAGTPEEVLFILNAYPSELLAASALTPAPELVLPLRGE